MFIAKRVYVSGFILVAAAVTWGMIADFIRLQVCVSMPIAFVIGGTTAVFCFQWCLKER